MSLGEVQFVNVIEAAIAERAPTLTLPRKRERERTAFWVSTVLSIRHGEPPLPLAGEGWGGGGAASEVTMPRTTAKWPALSRPKS